MSRKAASKKGGSVKSEAVPQIPGDESMQQCFKILKAIYDKPDAEPYRDPVDWEGWGLLDYPQIIKQPMDLGTIQEKLKGGKYANSDKFAYDMRLVWKNAMTYNRSDSDIYKTAEKFSQLFEKKFVELKTSPAALAPAPAAAAAATAKRKKPSESKGDGQKVTREDRLKFSQLVNQLASDDLGQLVEMIQKECPGALNEEDEEELEIEINNIDAATLVKLTNFAETCIQNANKRKKPKTQQ